MNQQMLFEIGLAICDLFVGHPIAIQRESDRRRAVQYALLSVLLAEDKGKASTDDIVRDPNHRYADGGKWIGIAVRELSDDGLIRRCDADRSKRPARNGGY